MIGVGVLDPKSSKDSNKKQEFGRRPTLHKIDTRSEKPRDSRTPPKDKKVEPKRNPEAVLNKQNPSKPYRPYTDESEPERSKPLNSNSAPVRPKSFLKTKVNNDMMVQQKPENRIIQKKPMPPQNVVSIEITMITVISILWLLFSLLPHSPNFPSICSRIVRTRLLLG